MPACDVREHARQGFEAKFRAIDPGVFDRAFGLEIRVATPCREGVEIVSAPSGHHPEIVPAPCRDRIVQDRIATQPDGALIPIDRKPKSSEEPKLKPTIAEVVETWNAEGPRLPKARKGGPQRDRHLQARLRADPERQTIAWWADLVRRIDSSKFLRGESKPKDGRTPFRADLAWVLSTEDNLTKIVEGRYDSSEPTRPEIEYVAEADLPFGGPRGDR
ncbi:MAG: hypothetical protein HYV07_34210 [Deltaproteobacteria bacterium]|nr:hypothetical protein [Deltaproteobacteria bacterium]